MRLIFLFVAFWLVCAERAFAQGDECASVVSEFNKAQEISDEQAFEETTWHDGKQIEANGDQRLFHNIYFRAVAERYRIFVRESRVEEVTRNSQVLSNKEITQHLQNGMSAGLYYVDKNIYRCEQRGGKWRIVEKRIIIRTIGTNRKAEREWKRFWSI